MSKFPAAKIDLEYSRTTKVVRDVLNGTVELGVLAFPTPRRGISIAMMPSNRLVLVAPPGHPLTRKASIKTKDLAGVNFVHFERDTPTRKATDRILKAAGVEVNKVAEFDNIETIKRGVEVGFGVAVLPEPSVEDQARTGSLVIRPMTEKEWERPIGVIYRSDRKLSVAAKKFIHLLEAEPTEID